MPETTERTSLNEALERRLLRLGIETGSWGRSVSPSLRSARHRKCPRMKPHPRELLIIRQPQLDEQRKAPASSLSTFAADPAGQVEAGQQYRNPTQEIAWEQPGPT
jgi:hypothetical protein